MKLFPRTGLTLFEGLIIVLVLAVVAAVLFPSFAKKRIGSSGPNCLNNSRQLVIGILIDAAENNESFPLPADWVQTSHLNNQSKLFDCPTSKRRGTAQFPEYGMNAFLFDFDPKTGKPARLPISKLADSTKVELLAELNGPTPKTGDKLGNPFPDTCTVNGFSGPGVNGDLRHTGGSIIAFADGHVAQVTPPELGAGTTPYNIPLHRREGK